MHTPTLLSLIPYEGQKGYQKNLLQQGGFCVLNLNIQFKFLFFFFFSSFRHHSFQVGKNGNYYLDLLFIDEDTDS